MSEVLYGRHAVLESLRARRRTPQHLWLAEGLASASIVSDIVAEAEAQRVRVETVSRQDIDRTAGTSHHQGVALKTSEYGYVDLYAILDRAEERDETPLVLLLDLIQDIHNVGSLVRTAEAAGVHGVIIQERRAAGITPAVVNTSSGAVEHLLVAQVTNLVRAMEQLKDADLWLAGLEDVYGAQPYTDIDMTIPLGLVVGSESDGLRRLVRERCDWVLRLPMYGEINSLNASIAASIAIYEALRQRRLVA
jgi:23S rRNA (guanosine2251-2'-O)-methyltransferase